MRVRGTDTPHVLDLVITDTYDIIDEIEIRSPLGESDHAIHCVSKKTRHQTLAHNFPKC